MRRWWAHPIARAVALLVALGMVFVAGNVVALGVSFADCCTAWDYMDEAGNRVASDGTPGPPYKYADWVSASAIMIGSLSVFLAGFWLAWRAIQPKFRRGDASRRWALRTRIVVWTWASLVVVMLAYAGSLHARNWAEWHELLATQPDIPYEPDPSQVPTGTAVVIGAILLVLLGVALLRARKRL